MPNYLLALLQQHRVDLVMYALVTVFALAVAWIMNEIGKQRPSVPAAPSQSRKPKRARKKKWK